MEISKIVDLFRQSIYIILIVTAPIMVAALLVGLIIAVFQATTQIQEQTLAFAPKIVIIFIVLLIFGPWIFSTIIGYTEAIFANIANVG